MRLDDENYMRMAFEQALKSYNEGGCAIGAVLVSDDSGAVLGQGHNELVQEGDPIIHAEMAALRAAGRVPNRHNTVLYTTLQPCFMCTGAIAQFGIPRVVIGDAVNAPNDETIRFLRSRGVEVVMLDPAASVCRGRLHCADVAVSDRESKSLDGGLGRRPQTLACWPAS